MAINGSDCEVLRKYRNAVVGSWTNMPEEDREVYRSIHHTLRDIAANTVNDQLQITLTSGFNVNGGIRG
jgi:hypothetical protein